MPCCTKPSKTKGATESVRRPAISKASGQPATYANAHPGQHGQPQGSARNPASRPIDRTTNTPATVPVSTGPVSTGPVAAYIAAPVLSPPNPAVAIQVAQARPIHLRYSSGNSPRSGHNLSSGYSPSYGHSHGKDSGATHCGGGSAPDGGC
jgi:hypothetical protein